MNSEVKKYLAEIGRKGGLKSRRVLSAAVARDMVRVREARRAYRQFHAQCFWSFDPHYVVTLKDLPWLCEQLMKNGNRAAWKVGERLCR
ncbi:MAG: hypothetical protein K1X64_03095 [Myxococcaceae bacterium]|nr:hypothetical protein [Myxococcaceae bacterium]